MTSGARPCTGSCSELSENHWHGTNIERVEGRLALALELLDEVYVLEGSDMDKRIRAFLAPGQGAERGRE